MEKGNLRFSQMKYCLESSIFLSYSSLQALTSKDHENLTAAEVKVQEVTAGANEKLAKLHPPHTQPEFALLNLSVALRKMGRAIPH